MVGLNYEPRLGQVVCRSNASGLGLLAVSNHYIHGMYRDNIDSPPGNPRDKIDDRPFKTWDKL